MIKLVAKLRINQVAHNSKDINNSTYTIDHVDLKQNQHLDQPIKKLDNVWRIKVRQDISLQRDLL